MCGTKKTHEIHLEPGEGMDGMQVGDKTPVYFGNDRESPIGTSEVVLDADGNKEILVTLDMENPDAQEVLRRINGDGFKSMSCRVEED